MAPQLVVPAPSVSRCVVHKLAVYIPLFYFSFILIIKKLKKKLLYFKILSRFYRKLHAYMYVHIKGIYVIADICTNMRSRDKPICMQIF